MNAFTYGISIRYVDTNNSSNRMNSPWLVFGRSAPQGPRFQQLSRRRIVRGRHNGVHAHIGHDKVVGDQDEKAQQHHPIGADVGKEAVVHDCVWVLVVVGSDVGG